MPPTTVEFRRGVIAPVECIKEAWGLIKDQYWLFLGICVVGMLVGSAFAIVLMGPMMCGIYLCILQHMRGQPVRFDQVFKGFDYFAQGVIAMLIQMVPTVILIVPMSLIAVFGMLALSFPGGQGGKEAGLFVFVAGMLVVSAVIFLVGILVAIFFIFSFPLIVDRKLSGVEAVKTSVKAAWANFGGACGLVLLCALLSLAGVLLCYIGALLVIPITMAAHAVAYRRVFPEVPQDGLSRTTESLPT